MAWLRVDDRFHANPKILEAGNAGAGLYVRALSYIAANLTDGHVPSSWVKQAGTSREVAAVTGARLWRPVGAGELVEATTRDGAVVAVTMPSPGYFVAGYLEFNPSRADVERERRDAAERQRKSRASRRESQGSHGDVTRDIRVSHRTPTRPEPDPPHEHPSPEGPSYESQDDFVQRSEGERRIEEMVAGVLAAQSRRIAEADE